MSGTRSSASQGKLLGHPASLRIFVGISNLLIWPPVIHLPFDQPVLTTCLCSYRMLPCGHSLCGDCLQLLYKPSNKELTCSVCCQAIKVESSKGLDQRFPKNYALIALAESNNKPTPPLIQMRMGTKKKASNLLKSMSSLRGAAGVKMILTRPRGNSDQLHT